MGIKTILVPLDGSDAAFDVLDTAIVVANRFGGHISAVHVSHSAIQSATYMFSGIPKSLRESVEKEDRAAIERQAEEVQARFESICRDNQLVIADQPGDSGQISASWTHESGIINDILLEHARLNDVIAFGRPQQKKNVIRRSPLGDTLQTILMESGRPVLVVPPQWKARKCEHAVIGWNHSQEASRALAMTIPWLKQMNKVTIAVSQRREQQGKRLIDYLAWHGIDAEVEILNRGKFSAGERLLTICGEIGGDFLVVGGFSTARAKERLFGGVTNHLLSASNVVTAMVH